jgi:LysM domain
MGVSTSSTRAVPVVTALREGWGGLPTRRGPARGGRCPEPAGPGRVRSRRRPSPVVPVARCGRVGRASAARPVSVRPRPGRVSSWVAPADGLSTAVRFVVVAALAAVAVVALGLLSDAVRQARVPEGTALVRVHPGESLWQVARRAAPSADPGAVAARIVELNNLPSPSVRDGDVLVSPVG